MRILHILDHSIPLHSGTETARSNPTPRPTRDTTARSLSREIPRQTDAARAPSSRAHNSPPAPEAHTPRPPDHTRRELVRAIDSGPTFGGSTHHGNGHTNGNWNTNRNHSWNTNWNSSWNYFGNNSWNSSCNTTWSGYPNNSWNNHTSYSNSPYGWWSTGIPSTLNTFGAYGNDPWSYANLI